jgi:hypothetical protein
MPRLRTGHKFARLLDDGVIEQAPGKRITASKPALVYSFLDHRRRST